MSWVTVIWSIGSGACLTLALMHAVVWWKDRTARANLAFSVMAIAVAAVAALELAMMRAETPGQFGMAARWIHVPAWVMIVSLVCFVRLYLKAGRRWLAWAIIGVRTLSLILNFVFSPNINYRQITALRHIPLLGESVAVAEGVPNPWMLVAQLSLLLLVIFVADATIIVWRRGDRRQAMLVGGSILFFVVGASSQAVAITWGIISMPLTVSLFYQGLVGAMAVELSYDVLLAAQITRRLQVSEAELREEHQRMDLATAAAELGIWMWDVARNEVWISEKGRALFGLAPSEKLDIDRFRNAIHPDDRDSMRRAVENSLSTGTEYEAEHRVLLPDGQVRWLAGHGRVEFDSNGKPARMRGVSADVTKRKMGEEALRESEERFRTMANTAPVMIWISGTDKLCTFFNKPWLEFTGRSMEQELGNGWADGVHADDLQRCHKVYAEAFDARQPFVMQYRLRSYDGGYRWVSDHGVPRYDGQKNFAGYIGSCVDVTELINKERALRESEERMSLAAEAANLAVWEWDLSRDEVWTTATHREHPGAAVSEKRTLESFIERIHIDDRDRVRQTLKSAINSGEDFASEFRFMLPDGRVRWATARGRCVRGVNGKTVTLRGISMDVTREMKKEEALREFEERVTLAAQAAHLGVWELDTATNEIWMSDSARALFQLDSEAQISPAALQDRVHPEDRARRDSAVKAALETQGEYEIEYRIVLPDGTLRWIGGRGRCVPKQDGDTRLIGVSIDITPQKQTQDLFRLATEASPSGVILVDHAGLIVLVNSHGEKLFGYSREELIGKSVDILVPERFASEHPSHRAKFLAAPTARAMGAGRELFARRKDGSEFPVEIGLNPIWTPQGPLVLANVVDISARIAGEEETRRRREQVELLSRVSLLGEMTASLAHELNQPLAAIMNNATAAIDYTEQGRLDPKLLKEILTDVIGDGCRAYDIIRNVRSAIKKGSAIRARINFNDVVKAVTHMVHPDAAANFCRVEISLAEDLPAIEGDPTQIQQVLINLVRNAFDAMRDTSPSRRIVEIATNSNGDGTISVAVRDYGCGIPEKTLERVFEQFFTTKEEGLGMGLAIVRSIVEAHGGTIAAENADGGGARFHFRLPAKEGTPQ